MEKEDYELIENQLGYKFNNRDLLQQAFVRRSYAKENGGADNEVLEFIGDRALDMIVTKVLVDEYGYLASDCDDYDQDDWDEFYSEKNEGQLTELKKKIVQRQVLANKVDELGWSQYLILGRGDRKNKVYNNDSVKEDLFEAVIGAITIDSKWDYEAIEIAIKYILNIDEMLEDDDNENYVSIFQDWYVRKYGDYPVFEVRNASYYGDLIRYSIERTMGGYYIINERIAPYKVQSKGIIFDVHEFENTHFWCGIELFNLKFSAIGDSKSDARRRLCKYICEYLDENALFYSIKDEIDNPNKMEAINQLETLARRGYFSIPTYEYKEKHDKDGNAFWKVECFIKERDYSFYAESSSKKDAKKEAAYSMLLDILESD